jgi:GTP cyclohydrolase I
MQKTRKLEIEWTELANRVAEVDSPNLKVYGVPKGGMILSLLFTKAIKVFKPQDANLIVDDLIDSGQTRDHYAERFPQTLFWAAFDKQGKDLSYSDTWLVFPWERDHPAGEDTVQANITRIIQYIGEDPNRAGIEETPDRVVKSYSEIFAGYHQNPADVFKVFEQQYDEVVLLKDIEFFSTCEHHMLPFVGKAHIAYIPNGSKVIGISKLARLLDIFAKRMQIQERIGQQVTSALNEYLQPLGAACIIESRHFCMCMRGVNKQNSMMVTSSLTGAFRDDPAARQELLSLIK